MTLNNSTFVDWVRCPECGYDNFTTIDIPKVMTGRNTYIKCPDCGQKGVRVG